MPNKAELTKMLLDKGFKEADFDGLSNKKMEELLKTEPPTVEAPVEETKAPEVTKAVEDTPPAPEKPAPTESVEPPVPQAPTIDVAPKVEAPKVVAPAEKPIELEKVRVIDNFTDLYIGGEYYSGKKKEFEEYPKNVARILRETGLAV